MDILETMTIGRRIMEVYSGMCQGLCEKFDINQSSLDVIMFIENHPGNNTSRDLCKIRGLKSSIVSFSVDALVKKGYLERCDDPADRRLVRLTLTPLAQPVAAEGHIVQQRFKEVLVSGITDQELEQYFAISKRLIVNLNNYRQSDSGLSCQNER